MESKAAKALLDAQTVTKDPRFEPFVKQVVDDLNGQLLRVRSQWLDGKIDHDMAMRRADTLRNRARAKIAKKIPQRSGAPMARI